MNFYCPSCRKEVDLEPTGTVTTKSGRIAYKASCPVCGLDLTEFAANAPKPVPAATVEAPKIPNETPLETKVQVELPSPSLPSATADETIKAYITLPDEEEPVAISKQPTEAVTATTTENQTVEAVDKEPVTEEAPTPTPPTVVEEFPIESTS